MVEDQPPGFRFYPTEEELISFYLHNKLTVRRPDLNGLIDRIIPVVNIYDNNPWELPQFLQHLCHRDPEQWFFFVPRQESEVHGGRPNRLTMDGYWKATGSPGFVYSSNNNHKIGEKRTMVFYIGRAPNGTKTEWKMNEYKAIDAGDASSSSGAIPMVRQELSLCRVYKKSNCLRRAFDRRPSLGVRINEPREPQRDHYHDAIMLADHQVIAQMAPAERRIIISLPESSSAGDHGGQQLEIGESSNSSAMNSSYEPWWDWDQLDKWFLS